MAHIVYVGDEITAAGFRLAGLETVVAGPGDAAEALRAALGDGRTECVLMSGALRDYVPPRELDAALESTAPLLALVPDVRGRGGPPDLARQVRNALGIDA
jgi:vacuolar-type H+-ATPase subunit F/Vma7